MIFYSGRLLASHPKPKLEDYPLSIIRDFSIPHKCSKYINNLKIVGKKICTNVGVKILNNIETNIGI
jgi:hypothetical protein